MRKGLNILIALALVLSMGLVMAGPMATPVAAAPPVTSGLVLHLDADAIVGLSDGQSVGTWPDLSPAGNHATQAAAAQQPAYKTGILNGKSVVRFDGSNDYLATASPALGGSHTVFVVAKAPNGGKQNTALAQWSSGTANRYVTIDLHGSVTSGGVQANAIKTFLDPTGHFGAAGVINTTDFFIVGLRKDGTTDVRHYVNGVLVNTKLSVAANVEQKALTVGAANDGVNHFAGDIAEILIYDRALSEGERLGVEQYLGIKWLGWSPPTEVWVDAGAGDDGFPGTETYPFATIQKGIDVVAAGGTVNVKAGTYVETGQLVINKNLTITGADKTTTIIKPDTNYTDWFVIQTGVQFHLDEVTLDGQGHNIRAAIRTYGSGSITNSIIENIRHSQYYGWGIALTWSTTGQNWTISGNEFRNIARVGILVDGAGNAAYVSGNTFAGNGYGDWVGYGVEVGDGAYAEVAGNSIYGYRGVASTDGSKSGAILVTSYFGPNPEALIVGNHLWDNTAAIWVGYSAGDTSKVVANFNNIAGNDEYGVSAIATLATAVDATNNWWGDCRGPDHATNPYTTTGDKVRGNVLYSPWLGAAYPGGQSVSTLFWHAADQKTASGTTTAGSVAKPDNLAEGDLVILVVVTQNSRWSANSAISTPDGFTQIRSEQDATAPHRGEVVAFYKIAGDSEPATYTFTVTEDVPEGDYPQWKAIAGRVTGHDPVNPVGNDSGTNSGSTGVTSLAIPSLTTSRNNVLLVAAVIARGQGAVPTNITEPATMAGLWSINGSSSGMAGEPGTGGGAEVVAAQGAATGTRTFSWTGSARAAGLMFEILPMPFSVTNASATPSTVWVGYPTDFTVTVSGAVGPSTYAWDFGDGVGTSTDASPTYTYTVAGTYTVMVTVTDCLGNTDSDSFQMSAVQFGVGLYEQANRTFRLKNELTGGPADTVFVFGEARKVFLPVAGDWDGDGLHGVGVYEDATRTFNLRNTLDAGAADHTFSITGAGRNWYPLAGDWNGDGSYGVGLYDHQNRTFYLKNGLTTGSADIVFTLSWARSGCMPVAGDWNGSGQHGVGLYNPTAGVFQIKNSLDSTAPDWEFTLGWVRRGWRPVAGDWNLSGQFGIGLYDPNNWTFYLKNALAAGNADMTFTLNWGRNDLWWPVAGLWKP